MGKAVARQHVTQAPDNIFVTVKIGEAHEFFSGRIRRQFQFTLNDLNYLLVSCFGRAAGVHHYNPVRLARGDG